MDELHKTIEKQKSEINEKDKAIEELTVKLEQLQAGEEAENSES